MSKTVKNSKSSKSDDMKRVLSSRSKRKSSKNYSESETRDSKSQVPAKFAGVTTNDPSWYVNNPALSRDVGSIFFSRPTGAKLFPNISGISSDAGIFKHEPGVMILKTILNWGGSTVTGDGTGGAIRESVAGSPMNLTATKLYQYVVHANSRNVSYDKKDLMMTMMAIDGVWQSIADAIRAYRLVAQYDVTNMYMSKLLSYLGWDSNDLKNKVAEFRYFINYAITRINKFFVPDLFDMWKSHVAAYTHIYLDQPTPKAQYIAKVPDGAWLYNDEEGCLEYIHRITFSGQSTPTYFDHTPSSMTVEKFRQLIDLQISRIEDSQYIGIIQGDLLKAFGFEHMAQFNYIDIDMPIYPVYDEEFIFKYHNADWWGLSAGAHIGSDYTAAMIYRDTDIVDGNIECLYAGGMGGLTTFGSRYIDLPDGLDSDASKVMIMSLFKTSEPVPETTKWRLSDTTSELLSRSDLMPEVISDVYIYYDPTNNDNVRVNQNLHGDADTQGIKLAMKQIWAMNSFKHAPAHMFRCTTTDESHPTYISVPVWQTDNLAEISELQLHRINTVILWSLWSSSLISSSTGV